MNSPEELYRYATSHEAREATYVSTLFGFEIATPLKLRARAMRSHGKICVVENRGPRASFFLSVYREHDGRTYEINKLLRGKTILRHFVPDWM